MDDYERLVKIGEGASGVVYKARDRRTGETVAIKRLRAGGGNGEGAAFEAAFRREVRCLEACRGGHPSLVALRAAHLEVDPHGGEAFLVMDYGGGSLAEVLREDRAGRPFAEPEARRVMRELLEGAAALHARGVLHRDIKPANVLLDARGGARICDFGLSRPTTARSGTTSSSPLTPGVATLWYRAPELILGSRDYDAGVDTWALGLRHGRAPLRRAALPGAVRDGPAQPCLRHAGSAGRRVVAWLRFAPARRIPALPPPQAARPAPGDVPGAVGRRVPRPGWASGVQAG
ncbi:hypothetical protein BS78_05G264700 [Paspalum vaginatum]|nr:hypothetical protein BS78_05G264700 [Paspalum vaginatum]